MLFAIFSYSLYFCLLIGIIEMCLIIYVQRRFKYRLPKRESDEKGSVKRMRHAIKSGEIADAKLMKYLRVISFLDYLMTLASLIVISVFLLAIIGFIIQENF